jgi:carbon-monoxide dehydrogenase medium subunit
VIPSAFDYQRATSIEDALARLAAAGGTGKLLAGGHSLVPLMKLRLTAPGVLIDISRVPGLAGIGEREGKIEIGAATVHHDIATNALVRARCPMLAETARAIGDPQVRNRGTIGGSLAHADPSADYPAAMLALDAEIVLRGPKGERVAPAEGFFRDLFTVDMAADEMITAVRFRPVVAAAYAKLYQRASHYAIVGVAAALEVGDGKIRSARIGVTGASPTAARLKKVEQALAGQPATAQTVEAAVKDAGAELPAVNSDLHASEEYRRVMVEVFTRRALMAALERA